MHVIAHGGAGGAPDAPDARQGVLDDAVAAGVETGSPVDAVVETVKALESSPRFNAGVGGAVQADGVVRTDAGIMVEDRSVGAVCSMPGVEHACEVARVVLEETPHVMVAGVHAVDLASEYGVDVDRDLWSDRTRDRWDEAAPHPDPTSKRAQLDWLDDGLAEYYAALLTHRQGRISERAFYDYVRTDRYAGAVLAETESVTDSASYFKGMRVLAALDARLRTASDGDRTLADLFRAVNDHPGPVTRATLTDLVMAGDGPDAAWVERHLTTSSVPSVPAFLPDDETTSAVDGEVGDVVDAAVAAPPVSQLLFVAGLACGVGTLLFRRRRP